MGTKRLRPPIHWYGSKWQKATAILRHTPDHDCYVELFAGGCSVLLAKEPSPIEVAVDIEGDICNFFRVLRDPGKREKLIELMELTPYSREELGLSIAKLTENGLSDIERAWAFCVCCNSARDGRAQRASDWSYTKKESNRGMSRNTSIWTQLPEILSKAGQRFAEVQIENDSWEGAIPRFDSYRTYFYADPPYFPGTRVLSKAYKFEMSEEDHERFLKVALGIKGIIAISGYSCEMYDDLLSKWRKIEIKTKSFASPRDGRKLPERTECLWMSYPDPTPVNFDFHAFLNKQDS